MTAMKQRTAPHSFAERAGRALGRAWRGFLRRERSACEWLVSQGLPPGIAKTLLLILRLAVLGVVLYVAFWVALMGFIIVAGIWGWWNADPDWRIWKEEEPEWREGFEGFGLYQDDIRIDYCDSDNYCYDDD
jgi:hypothetical protein